MTAKIILDHSKMTAEQKEMCGVVVCMLVSELPTPHVPAHKEECGLCTAPIWVAETSPLRPIKFCLSCAEDFVKGPRQ